MVRGVGGPDARDPRKAWTAILRVAMSACRRGWTEAQFMSELTKTDRHRTLSGYRLWEQLRERTSPSSSYRQLHKAWDCAVANLNGVGERTIGDLRADAIERAYLWTDRITDGMDGLTVIEAGVMGYVISETERRAMTRVTCPSRVVAEAAKTSAMTASRTLNDLTARGFLVKHSPGRASPRKGPRRAAIYGLTDPEALPNGGRKRRRRPAGRGTRPDGPKML